MSREQQMQETYDSFRQYIENSCRDETNPTLTVERFGDIGKQGVTHLPIELQNVQSGSFYLFKKVNAFKKGTELKTEEIPETESNRYVAYVPYRDAPQQQQQQSYNYGPPRPYDYHQQSSSGPSALVLQGLVVMLLVLIIIYMYNFMA